MAILFPLNKKHLSCRAFFILVHNQPISAFPGVLQL